MKRDYRIYLKDIFDSIIRIENYVLDLNYEDFEDDRKTVDAIVRNIEIIGEATKNIPDSVRKNYPDIPWKEMARMRDKMIHGYFEISHSILWETIKHDLPFIKPKIMQILEE
jgi:uncharacterized protein with HEPN domain